MVISKKIVIHEEVSDIKQKILTFWQSRGIEFTEVTESSFKGNRGSLVGNMISFDMAKILTNVHIVLSGNELISNIQVDTKFQYITTWNKEYWDLELETFESVLLNNNHKEDEWEDYNKMATKKSMFLMGCIIVISAVSTFFLNLLLK